MSEIVMEGRVLADKYEITRLLGQGGMGAVYEARNHLGKRFAVKLLLKPELLNDQQLIQRFFREAKASAAIESEHIVEVYDTGHDTATRFPFIIMELLKGEDLEHTIARVGALSPLAASRVICQAAEGLGHAHSAGIVHRDIKPANIFMSMRGPGDLVVKILDFGIAKQAVEQLSSADGAGLTKTGSMLGTPLYMSPEQARGLRTVDARTDLWSLGMCLYEALSGRTPWGSVDTLGDLILSICARDVMPLQEVAPWVPAELAAVVHRALARDPAQRIPSAQALIEALTPFAGGTMFLTPDVLTGVQDAQRQTAAPRLDLAHVSSVAAMTSSQPGNRTTGGASNTGQHGAAPAKKPLATWIGIGAAALIVLSVGGFAVSRAFGGGGKKAAAGGGDSTEQVEVPTSSTGDKPEEKKPEPVATVTATAPTQAPTQAPTASAAPSESAATTATTTTTSKPVAGKPTAKPTGKPSTTSAPSTTAAPATTSTGRKITETL